jgi:hypothetical protein
MAATCKKCDCLPKVAGRESFCPHMSDGGRGFTNFAPRCTNLGPPLSSYDRRQYYINNAQKIINNERADLFTRMGCVPCFGFEEPGTVLPQQSEVVCNERFCTFKVKDPCGLGVGRGNTSLDVQFKDGSLEVPFYPIGGAPEGNYASASEYSSFNVSTN